MTYRAGVVAAWTLAGVGVLYAVVVAVAIANVGSEPIRDPVFAVMEVLTVAAALLIVILMAAIYERADPAGKLFALIALSFAVIMAGLTAGVHFVALTAGRQTGLTTLEWPSTLYAVELLAWDVFLGFSLLFAAPVFRGPGLPRAVRWSLTVTGALCLLGTSGPLTGDMSVQRIGMAGYGAALPFRAR